MANDTQTLTFKLVIDGKETVATVEMIKRDFEELNGAINKIQDRPIIKQFAKDLLLVDTSAEEATTGIMDFIKYNEMTEPEIQSVINSLREEQKVLAVGSAQWRYHGQAIENLSGAYQRTIAQQRAFTGTSSSARMAVSQFGFALGDASMIAVDFRMFLLSIGNNIPFIVQGLAQVSQEAKTANMSLGSFLKQNFDASMKLVLGANALMFALTVLPAIFNKINEKSKVAAEDGLKKFNDQLKNMTKLQIGQMINERSEELSKLQLKGQLPAFTVGEGSTRVTTSNRLTEDEAERTNALIKELELLYKRKATLGDEFDLGLKINVNEEKRRSLTKDNYNEIVKQATSLDDARKILSDWIESDKKQLEKLGGFAGKNKNFAEEFNKRQEHEINMLKLSTDNNLRILKEEQKLLAEKKAFYLKYGQDITEINYAIAEKELEFKKHVQDENNKFLDKDIKPRGLQIEGVDNLIKPPSKKDFDKYYADLNKEKKEWEEKSKKLEKEYQENSKENFEQKMIDEQKIYEDAYIKELISKEDFERAKDLIEQYYARKSQDRDQKVFLTKINTMSQIVDAMQSAFNSMYDMASNNASYEVNAWKDKEDKKLKTERDAALKRARTQAQRERINEQFDKKQEQLEDEANKRAADKLMVWFRLKQAGDIASTTMTTYSAATSALKEPPVGLGPIFGWPFMIATIAGGLANVAMIAQQKLPGYAKGGAVVGEDGPEIIAPFQDYASGQSKLIAMTMMTLKDEIRSGRSSGSSSSIGLTGDYGDIKAALNKLNKHLDDGISARAYLDDREAKRVNSRGAALNRRAKL